MKTTWLLIGCFALLTVFGTIAMAQGTAPKPATPPATTAPKPATTTPAPAPAPATTPAAPAPVPATTPAAVTTVTPPPPPPTVNVVGLKPFSPECGFKSLAGFYRWSLYKLTGQWITPDDAQKAVDMQLAAAAPPPPAVTTAPAAPQS